MSPHPRQLRRDLRRRLEIEAHTMEVAALEAIRRWHIQQSDRVATWQPGPMPEDFR